MIIGQRITPARSKAYTSSLVPDAEPRAAASRLRRPSPRPAAAVCGLEGGNPVAVALRQVDVVPAVEQLIAAHRIDAEREGAIAACDRLPLEVDYDGQFRLGGDGGAEFEHVGFGEDGGEQAVLDRILREDVAERRCDHAADAGIVERIDGRFARRAAAEIAAGDEDLGVAPGRLIEREVGPFVARGVAPQVLEQDAPKFRRTRPFQVAPGQNLIGIDVGQKQRAGLGGEANELLHRLFAP